MIDPKTGLNTNLGLAEFIIAHVNWELMRGVSLPENFEDLVREAVATYTSLVNEAVGF